MSFASIYRRIIYAISDATGLRFLRNADSLFSWAKSIKSRRKGDRTNREYALNMGEKRVHSADVPDTGPAFNEDEHEKRFDQMKKTLTEIIQEEERKKPGMSELSKMRSIIQSIEEKWKGTPEEERNYDNFFDELIKSDLKKFIELYADCEVKIQR